MRRSTRVGLYSMLAFLTVAASLSHPARAPGHGGPGLAAPAKLANLPCTVTEDAKPA